MNAPRAADRPAICMTSDTLTTVRSAGRRHRFFDTSKGYQLQQAIEHEITDDHDCRDEPQGLGRGHDVHASACLSRTIDRKQRRQRDQRDGGKILNSSTPKARRP